MKKLAKICQKMKKKLAKSCQKLSKVEKTGKNFPKDAKNNIKTRIQIKGGRKKLQMIVKTSDRVDILYGLEKNKQKRVNF